MIEEWPSVLVQLPIYNERYVVERLIDTVAALDYPHDRLMVQVLDDSTDETCELAQLQVERYQKDGFPIQYIHRQDRTGFKAGALAAGMEVGKGDLIAVFDADFTPTPDFLRQMVPVFLNKPQLGMLQARWEHINTDQNFITHSLALGFDSFFSVEQLARSRAAIFMNFNGSAGIWRRACIEDAGGWHQDTLVEDTDLSYRAQLRNWQLAYQPDVAVSAELPDSILILKQQQFRWAKGSIQVLRKVGYKIIISQKSIFSKLEGLIQLSGYVSQPLILLSLLLSLPVVLMHGQAPFRWAPLGLASVIPPVVALWGQLRLKRPNIKSWLHYPVLFLTGIGLAISNTHAILEGFAGKPSEFVRTPKHAQNQRSKSVYKLKFNWTVYGELAMAIYGLVTVWYALRLAPDFAPFILIYALAFAFTASLSMLQSQGI